MDVMFIPGDSDDAGKGARKFFPTRPGVKLVTPRPVKNHLEGLLGTLGVTPPPVTLPIGDIITYAHGADIGQYFIRLKGSVPEPADFEKVVVADTANTIRIDAALVTPAGGGAQNTITVRLMGCNVGQARPLIEKFKAAMTPTRGAINMIAPLHFDEIHSIKGGLVEYLAHNFTLRLKDKLKDRAAVLAAFDHANFKYLDGTAIPTAAWNDWIPATIHPPDSSWKQKFDMFVDLDPPANGQTVVKVHREYRFRMYPFEFGWNAPDPGNDHDRIELLRHSLPKGKNAAGLKLHDPAYPWPFWKRFGFTTLDNFVDNLNWKDDHKGNNHHFTASMAEYTVMLPLTDPPGAAPPGKPAPPPKLKFYNFYPDAAGTANMHIDETNASLFLIL